MNITLSIIASDSYAACHSYKVS